MDSRYGAVVLCGGASSRMGQDKAWLPFGNHATLLARVVEILAGVVAVERIVVVAGRRQQVPPLAEDVVVVHESGEGAGPLSALVEGLAALPHGVNAAFACGCDSPLLRPAFVARLLAIASPGVDAVVPADTDRLYPLAAVYSRRSLQGLRASLEAGERSLHRVLRGGRLAVLEVSVDDFRAVDSQLDSLVNCNTLEEYQAAAASAEAVE